MPEIRIENWNNHHIRFVEKEPGDWWAVAKDIADALDFRDAYAATRYLPEHMKGTLKGSTPGGEQEMIIVSEKGIYRLIMRSNKAEAEVFQEWVYDILKALREATGLEGFQVFRMMDKDHQKEAMDKLRNGLASPVKVDYIKANTIANKVVSNIYGYPKMVKKNDMPPEWLPDRQRILDETVELMTANEKFALGLKVSETIYSKYA